jgi:3-oxoacyl-[acyl-carrier protein] reductase
LEDIIMSKTILITGASTGIGAATARHLAASNEIIVHYCSSQEAAELVAKDVEAAGGKAYLAQADLTTEAGCRQLVHFAAERCGKLDVLVNNTGGLIRRCAARELDWQLMLDTFALNTFSTMLMSSLCIPLLQNGHDPCIVNVTSVAVRHGAPSATIYGASKGALDTFTRGLAKELAPAVRVNAVAPGVIDTPFHAHVTSPEKMAEFKASMPLKRIGQPEEIATAIAFLIDNLFITGETIDINGGGFMR